ncbi:MAG: hypothetical protein JXA60_08665 [Candidatus Coatesbacteria bacterium]|nr:hypothetical protein [Candidatus Coatesbacteria bacterium]
MSYLNRNIIKTYFAAALIIIGLVFLIFTYIIYSRLEEHAESVSNLVANYFAVNTIEALKNPSDFKRILAIVDFPIIITDENSVAQVFVDINERDEQKLKKIIKDMDSTYPPIPIVAFQDNESIVIGHLHRGKSKLGTLLRFIPFIQFGLVSLFSAVGLMAFRVLRTTEQSYIWVGMAKETAHQLGTPLTSILGWLQMLEEYPSEDKHEIREMKKDIERLNKIVSRFGLIGSLPKFQDVDLNPLIDNLITYFEERTPHLGLKRISIVNEVSKLPVVKGNQELLEWVFENLLKNSITAMDKDEGIITISGEYDEFNVKVRIVDNGRGILPSNQKAIFDPGFTSKKKGWGLGLALARRIVEEYHQGQLQLVSSKIGIGSIFEVIIPLDLHNRQSK